MGATGKYDITNDEQLRILTARLDELADERRATNDRLDRLVKDGDGVVKEWQGWRKKIEEQLGINTQAIAERLAHPLMDPGTVDEMRRAQAAITAHLNVQDTAVAALTQEINRRLAPFERVTEKLDQVVKMLRWAMVAGGGGFLYEVGRVVVDRWLK
jgi:hypothetical protein